MMTSSPYKPLVFVTGASGYIGYGVVYQLLEAGYRVRGAARNTKVDRLNLALKKYVNEGLFEAVEIPDIASGDLKKILAGADAVIHTAAPLIGKSHAEVAFRTAVEGSLHVLEEGYKLGIKRFAVTGSVASFPSSGPFGDDDWNTLTKEEAIESNNPRTIYLVQKKVGEQAVREFSKEHPETRIAIFNPPYVYGPFSPGFQHILGSQWKDQLAAGTRPLSTAGQIYGLLEGEKANNFAALQPVPYVDIRDVAKVHIAALQLDHEVPEPLNAPRLLVVSPYLPKFGESLEVIRKERPSLEGRLVRLEGVEEVKGGRDLKEFDEVKTGLKKIEEVLGIREDEYKTFRETILDTVDSLIALEGFNWGEI
ncbi:hypothetical protein D9758_016737 [Tetrapyrgos nigripes]|nr:hypothetical protein D9758_016737 [Tetrapyrgos nigripes]